MRRRSSFLLCQGVAYLLFCSTVSTAAAAVEACDSRRAATVGAVLLQKAAKQAKVRPAAEESESTSEGEIDQASADEPAASDMHASSGMGVGDETAVQNAAAELDALAKRFESSPAEEVPTASKPGVALAAIPAAVAGSKEATKAVKVAVPEAAKAVDEVAPAAVKAAPEVPTASEQGVARTAAPAAVARSKETTNVVTAAVPEAVAAVDKAAPAEGKAAPEAPASSKLDVVLAAWGAADDQVVPEASGDSPRHRIISAALMGPAGGQASMAHDADASTIDKVAVGSLDFVATGVHTEYCKNWLHEHSFLCESGAVLLSLLVCTPLIALSVAAFWGIVTGLRSLKE